MDIESKRPMPRDGVFRLASMLITAVAVMMMVEEGKVSTERPCLALHPRVQVDESRCRQANALARRR